MAYRSYQKGFLSEEGSLLSQPHHLIEAIKTIDMAVNRCESYRQEQEAKKKSRR